jgi:putative toxin-antitoxin system antitoxin component (TIGR02293 family)
MNPRTRIQQYQRLKDLRRKGPLPEEARHIPMDEDAPSVFEVRALADRVFADPEKAERWFGRPNRSMSGQKPIDLMQDEVGAAVVRDTLYQIDHGIFA